MGIVKRSGPLARTVPLAHTPGLSRSPRQRGAPRETGFSRSVKLAIRTRAGDGDPANARCEHSGVFLGPDGGDYQHVVARGMGGTRNALLNSAANGVLLSRPSHNLAESRDPEMRAQGFWLHGLPTRALSR